MEEHTIFVDVYAYYIYNIYIYNIEREIEWKNESMWEIYYKDLAHMTMEADKSQGLQRASWRPRRQQSKCQQAWDQRKSWCFSLSPKAGKNLCSSLKAVRLEVFPLTCRRISLFVLFSPSTDWVRPTHIRKGNLLYSVYWFKC